MGFGVWGLGFGVWGLGFGVWGLGFGVWGLGFGVWGLGFGVWGLGFRVSGLVGVRVRSGNGRKGRALDVKLLRVDRGIEGLGAEIFKTPHQLQGKAKPNYPRFSVYLVFRFWCAKRLSPDDPQKPKP